MIKKQKVKKKTIYRCPWCSKKPKVVIMNVGGDGILDPRWVAICASKNHYASVKGLTRAAVIKKWNKGR